MSDRGRVKWFNNQKGYGFITPDKGGSDVFVHISAVEESGLDGLKEDQAIEYDLVEHKGRNMAANLREY